MKRNNEIVVLRRPPYDKIFGSKHELFQVTTMYSHVYIKVEGLVHTGFGMYFLITHAFSVSTKRPRAESLRHLSWITFQVQYTMPSLCLGAIFNDATILVDALHTHRTYRTM